MASVYRCLTSQFVQAVTFLVVRFRFRCHYDTPIDDIAIPSDVSDICLALDSSGAQVVGVSGHKLRWLAERTGRR